MARANRRLELPVTQSPLAQRLLHYAPWTKVLAPRRWQQTEGISWVHVHTVLFAHTPGSKCRDVARSASRQTSNSTMFNSSCCPRVPVPRCRW